MPSSSLDTYRDVSNCCTYRVNRHRLESVKETLQRLADSTDPFETTDNYGTGALIEQFEQDVATMRSACSVESNGRAGSIDSVKIGHDISLG